VLAGEILILTHLNFENVFKILYDNKLALECIIHEFKISDSHSKILFKWTQSILVFKAFGVVSKVI